MQGAVKVDLGTDIRDGLPTGLVRVPTESECTSRDTSGRGEHHGGEDSCHRFGFEELLRQCQAPPVDGESSSESQRPTSASPLSKLMLKANGKKGVPQGGVISPLLSNVYLLTQVDEMLERARKTTRESGSPASSTLGSRMTWSSWWTSTLAITVFTESSTNVSGRS